MTNESGQGIESIVGHSPVHGDEGHLQVQFQHREPLQLKLSDWFDLNLKVGALVDARQMADIETAAEFATAERLAIRYLGVRARAEREVQTYLARKGVSPSVCQRVIKRLTDHAYLDDASLANQYVQQMCSKMSRREMAWRLRQRGVSEEVVEHAVASAVDIVQEKASARALAIRNSRRFGPNPSPNDWTKISAYLQRKGFTTSVIMSTIKSLKLEIEHNDVSDDM